MKEQTFHDKTFNVIKGTTHPEYSYFTFESEEREFRDKYWNIKKDDVVFDIGASYGTYTLSACSMGAKVYSFEPEKTIFSDLVQNININNWNDICVLENVGLWSSETILHMKSYAPHWSEYSISGYYKMVTLDQMVNKYSINKIDWIKIDVEGAEEHVILGGLDTIKTLHPNLIIECHVFLEPKIKNNIKNMLASLYDYEFEEVDRDPCVMLIAMNKVGDKL